MRVVAYRMIAKRVPPRLSGIVLRPRLFRKLDVRQPLTWVWGQPGSGKTVLVASYLAARRIRSLWYRLDAGDADVVAFLHDLTRDGGRRHAQRLRAHAGSPAILALLRTLYDRLPRPFVLVLDSYDEVPPDAPLHEVIRDAVMQLPPGGRIIVTSRAVPPPAFARLRASQAIAEVGGTELRLTAAETRRLVRQVARKVPAQAVATLQARTHGWAAGLVLLLQERRRFADERRGVPDGVVDYFAAEILEKMDPDVQNVLLRTAFLPRVTGAMAEALTHRSGAGNALVALHRQNCFVVEHTEPETAYEYHPLFRAFLQRRAHAVFSPEQRAEIQRTAAALLAREGRMEDAGVLLRAARDWEGLADLVETHAATLSAQGRLGTVGEWVSALPTDFVRERAWPLYWRGMSRLEGDPAASRDDFETALKRFRLVGDATGAFLAWAGGVRTLLLEREDFRPLDSWIVLFDDLLRQFVALPSRDVETRVASSMLVALLCRQPQHPEIKAWARLALTVVGDTADRAARLRNIHDVLVYKLWIGDFEDARPLADELRMLSSDQEASPLDRIGAALAIGRLEWLTGAFAAARETIERALSLARSSGIGVFTHPLLCDAAMAALSEGDRPAARRWLTEIRRDLARLPRCDRAHYRLLVGWEALLAGKASTAVGEHERLLTATLECGMPGMQCLAHLFAAQALQTAGTPGAAVHLAQASTIAQEMGSPLLTFMVGLIEADIAVQRGDEGHAVQTLAVTLPLGRAHDYLNTWMWRSATMAELASLALDAGIEVDYVRRLIRERHLVPAEPPVHVETWPWPIKIFTLGRFEVLTDERPLRFPGKAQKKPLALLRALVALGGQNVNEERVAELLWPDAEGDAAHQALSVTLHRLRRLLGHDRAVIRNDGRLTLDPAHCWVDVWSVERTLARAEAAIARSPVRDHEWAASIRWTDRATAFYRGEFLAGDRTLPWAATVNARVKEHLLRQLRKIGHVWEGIGDWEEAAQCYERAVAINDAAEEFYRRLILAYEKLHRWGDAILAYERCRKALAWLGTGPSPETEAAVSRLKHLENKKV
jgi:ATP/maltotriose-dependent transcriptional regulator MalT/DNA-binding SARP family transcriptional activator